MKNRKTESGKKGKNTEKRTGKFVPLLLAAVVLLGSAYIVCYSLSGDKDSLSGYLQGGEAGKTDKFIFDAYSDNIFEEINGGLLAVSASAYQVFDSSGEIVGRGTKAFTSPAVSSGAGGAVVWSQGGNNILLVSTDGATNAIDSENAVISASVNDNGYAAVSFEQSGYKGLVAVYNSSAEVIYKWYSGLGYLVDAAVNNSNTAMMALTLYGNRSRLVSYSLGSEEEQGAYSEENTIYFDMDYISENRVCAVADTKAVFLNGKCEYNAEYSFGGWYLKNYSLDGNGFAVFALGKFKTGGETLIVSVDAGGNVQGSVTLGEDVEALSVRGRYIAVTCADCIMLYNEELQEIGREDDAAGVEKALACADGKMIVVSANGAVEYDY